MRETPSPVRRFFGGLLFTAGVLIAGLSGLCSASVLVIAFSGGGRQMATILPLIFSFGLPPLMIGIGLIFAGRELRRG